MERLSQTRLRVVVLAFGVLLVAPSMFSGFALDDYILMYQADRPRDGEWAGSAPFDLFRWMDPEHDRRLIDGGGMPWWTYERTTLAFMRPITSLTHSFDHFVLGKSPVLSHLHSVLWFALLLGVAALAYARLIEDRWVAGVATAMFALDSAHGSAVGWISNRNAAIAGAFGVLTLLCHHAYRSGRGWSRAALGWTCFALSLCSGELALGVPAYLFAYALCRDRGSLAARLGSLAPYLLLGAAWAYARSALGYGSFGLGAYVDPVREPLAFLAVLPLRFVVLVSSQFSRVASDLYDLAPVTLRPALTLWSVAMVAVLGWFLLPSLRREASARFWTLGAALSVVPLTATIPNDRLLTLVGFGVMPALAYAMRASWEALRTSALSRSAALRSACAVVVALVHLVIDPLLLPLVALTPSFVANLAEASDASLPADASLTQRTLIVAAVPDSLMLSYLHVMRAHDGRPRPAKLYWLAATAEPVRFERRAPNVLRVAASGGLFDPRSEARSPRFALQAGARVELSEVRIDVLERTPDGRPTLCDFVFDEPLESSRYVWRTWANGGMQEFTPPAPGQSQRSEGG
ncbi:MAG TPA: hypothetical protein VJR89_16620 [Polyangiales bacterium]|nr:hypothetical protein [Polyangiales bacterium]